jgi:ABC-type amino acid transport system permease subunit
LPPLGGSGLSVVEVAVVSVVAVVEASSAAEAIATGKAKNVKTENIAKSFFIIYCSVSCFCGSNLGVKLKLPDSLHLYFIIYIEKITVFCNKNIKKAYLLK